MSPMVVIYGPFGLPIVDISTVADSHNLNNDNMTAALAHYLPSEVLKYPDNVTAT